jgi:hypothetical protein
MIGGAMIGGAMISGAMISGAIGGAMCLIGAFFIMGIVAEITMGIGVVNRIPMFFLEYDKRAISPLDVNFKKFIKIK